MKLKEAMLVFDDDTKELRVVHWPEMDDESSHYRSSVGACETAHREMSTTKQLHYIVFCFHYLTTTHGFDPKHVHDELMHIDEYKEHCEGEIFAYY